MQRHATLTGKYRATTLSTHFPHRFVTLHPQQRQGRLRSPPWGLRGHFVPQPTGAPGLPRQVGDHKGPLPPTLPLWAGEPVELG